MNTKAIGLLKEKDKIIGISELNFNIGATTKSKDLHPIP